MTLDSLEIWILRDIAERLCRKHNRARYEEEGMYKCGYLEFPRRCNFSY